MEDTLGVNLCLKWLEIRLNPCFSGRYSRSSFGMMLLVLTYSLNPCFSGRYSRRTYDELVFHMSDGVLILILVEDTLGAPFCFKHFNNNNCLNPCFSGRYSRSVCNS